MRNETQHDLILLLSNCTSKLYFLSCTPIRFIQSSGNISMKTGMKPVCRSIDQSMFHRIVMYVFHMLQVIFLVLYFMLPKTALPDSQLVFSLP